MCEEEGKGTSLGEIIKKLRGIHGNKEKSYNFQTFFYETIISNIEFTITPMWGKGIPYHC